MKIAVVAAALACLAPGLGFAASLTGSNVESSASVTLASVGTLDWARWPGYTHKGTAISNVTTTGTLKTYSSGPRLVDGVELLAYLLHPDAYSDPGIPWSRVRV